VHFKFTNGIKKSLIEAIRDFFNIYFDDYFDRVVSTKPIQNFIPVSMTLSLKS